jgi:hypothetical protein
MGKYVWAIPSVAFYRVAHVLLDQVGIRDAGNPLKHDYMRFYSLELQLDLRYLTVQFSDKNKLWWEGQGGTGPWSQTTSLCDGLWAERIPIKFPKRFTDDHMSGKCEESKSR